jgi:BASS family bile acid:Na+ symporter
MSMDQFINVLVLITLIDMMVAVGLGVSFADLLGVARNWRLVLQAILANYVGVPAVTIGLLILFHPADPMVGAGFLILAVCPGAPFGPPCTALARGNVSAAVGAMVVLAATSALAAPLLLQLLLPWMSGGGALEVNTAKIVNTLVLTQLLPLGAGLWLRHWRPRLAERLQKPANLASAVLGLVSIGLILVVQFDQLAAIGGRGWVGMSLLLIATWIVGWLLGGPSTDDRKAMALTTSLRNVGVGLVIATGNFAGSAAVTATTAYGIFEILGSLLLAMAWGRWETATIREKSESSTPPFPREGEPS